MENVSISIIILFLMTTLFTCYELYLAANRSLKVVSILAVWMTIITIAGIGGFYQNFNSIPPRFVLLPAPPLLFCIILPFTKRGRNFIDSLNLSNLTLLHVSRIPVEITLYYLAIAKLIPEVMTFEGLNYDILSGIFGGLMFLFVFRKKWISPKWLLVWNVSGLLLLINIVIIAILSLPAPFQKLAFNQPNIGLAIFPFIWLPGIIVPIVFFSHISAILKLSVGLFNFALPLKPLHRKSTDFQ